MLIILNDSRQVLSNWTKYQYFASQTTVAIMYCIGVSVSEETNSHLNFNYHLGNNSAHKREV